jgi:hypothetical protein
MNKKQRSLLERMILRQRTRWASHPQACIIAERKRMKRLGPSSVREERRWLLDCRRNFQK